MTRDIAYTILGRLTAIGLFIGLLNDLPEVIIKYFDLKPNPLLSILIISVIILLCLPDLGGTRTQRDSSGTKIIHTDWHNKLFVNVTRLLLLWRQLSLFVLAFSVVVSAILIAIIFLQPSQPVVVPPHPPVPVVEPSPEPPVRPGQASSEPPSTVLPERDVVPAPGEQSRLRRAEDPSISECDRLASHPRDADRPVGVSSTDDGRINLARAVHACEAAVRQHPSSARMHYLLGRVRLQEGKSAEALRLFAAAANAGHCAANGEAGNLLSRTGGGIAADFTMAARWFERGHQCGNLVGTAGYASALRDGRGVRQDVARARTLFERAMAATGDSYVTFSYACLLRDGRGGPADRAQASALLARLRPEWASRRCPQADERA